MRISEITKKIILASEKGIYKTNASFWSKFPDVIKFNDYMKSDHSEFENSLFYKEYFDSEVIDGVLGAFDEEFPVINHLVKNNSEKPVLLFYKGDISLLNNLNNNVAIIGTTSVSKSIELRETELVKSLVKGGLTIVSGLAPGCDSIAHNVTIKNKGATVAILPSTLKRIIPVENEGLANNIVKNGGLLVTEYYLEPTNTFEPAKRYIDRDRLQAMFTKAVILVASFRKGDGDSGSRHAMESAQKYGIGQYVIFNEENDRKEDIFGLNSDLIDDKNRSVKIITNNVIKEITDLQLETLKQKKKSVIYEQMSLL